MNVLSDIQQQTEQLLDAYRLKEAQQLLQEKFIEIKTQYTPNSEEYAQMLTLIARWHIAASEYDAAKPLLQQSLLINNQQSQTYVALATLNQHLGQYKHAQDYYQQALTHSNTTTQKAIIQIGLGNNLLLTGQWEQALSQFEQAATVLEQHYGLINTHTIDAYRQTASIYRYQNNLETAISIFTHLLEYSKQLPTTPHIKTAVLLSELAFCYDLTQQFELAQPLHQQANQLCKQIVGKQHYLNISLLARQAEHHLHQHNFQAALTQYRQALSIAIQTYGTEHQEVQKMLHNLSSLELALHLANPNRQIQ